jgi:hypothetical protein
MRDPGRGRSPPYLWRSLRRSTESVVALAGSVAGANCPDPPNGTTGTEQAVRLTRIAIAWGTNRRRSVLSSLDRPRPPPMRQAVHAASPGKPITNGRGSVF